MKFGQLSTQNIITTSGWEVKLVLKHLIFKLLADLVSEILGQKLKLILNKEQMFLSRSKNQIRTMLA